MSVSSPAKNSDGPLKAVIFGDAYQSGDRVWALIMFHPTQTGTTSTMITMRSGGPVSSPVFRSPAWVLLPSGTSNGTVSVLR